jgi:hypothetical protein
VVNVGGATFSERVATRKRLWWGRLGTAHRLRERRARRHRDDPAGAWRCCAYWPRTLVNKWNAREFAARHGAELPALYWKGSDHSSAPLERLPDQFVIRPIYGAMKRGVAVVANGRELLHDRSADPSQLRRTLPRTKLVRTPASILIEEFIQPHSDSLVLPLEYKCHTFAHEVMAVQVTARRPGMVSRSRYYTPGWQPMADRMNTFLPPDEQIRERPPWLELMLGLASALGAEIGTYMRIDFFGGRGGCVFNEFSTTPGNGANNTRRCDELFGAAWARNHPGAT